MISEDNKLYFTIEEGDTIIKWMKTKVWSYARLGQELYVTGDSAKLYVLGVRSVPKDVIERFKKLNIEGVNFVL